LFPGGSQYQRFSGRLLELGSELLTKQGIDIGSHSIRKGAASYVSSGSTMGPSAAAICIRAGWTMGSVQDRYIRYEGAGDMFVGRTVAGLPVSDVQFAILPPFFNEIDDVVEEMLKDCFPQIEGNMRRVCLFAVASVIYHSEVLCEKLPTSHPLFSTSLFTNKDRLEQLRSNVQSRLPTISDSMQSTGIPPHVNALVMYERLNRNLLKVGEAVYKACAKTTKDVKDFFRGESYWARQCDSNSFAQRRQFFTQVCIRYDGIE
jgi:hypothetical protein